MEAGGETAVVRRFTEQLTTNWSFHFECRVRLVLFNMWHQQLRFLHLTEVMFLLMMFPHTELVQVLLLLFVGVSLRLLQLAL